MSDSDLLNYEHLAELLGIEGDGSLCDEVMVEGAISELDTVRVLLDKTRRRLQRQQYKGKRILEEAAAEER